MKNWDMHTRFATVAMVSSESGDRNLYTFDGWPDYAEMRRMIFEEAPDWWEDEEYIYIEDVIQLRSIDVPT